jgi:hypothetical protein
MAESTALEALTAELLGDVGLLHDQVKALRAALPNIAQEVSSALELQTGNMLGAANRLREVMSDMAKQVDASAEAAAKKAVATVKMDIQQAATEAAKASVRSAVGEEVRTVVALINEAAVKLANDAARTSASITAASQEVTWGWAKGLLAIFGASMLGALALFLALHMLGLVSIRPAELSEEDRRALNSGHALSRVWGKLTPKERDRIVELVKANP